MTSNEIQELVDSLIQSLRIRLVEAGARSCHTGLNLNQVKEILLYSALNELHSAAESWNIQHTQDFLPNTYPFIPEKRKDLFNA